MVCLDQSTRYICRSTTPSPPAPLPRSGFVLRPYSVEKLALAIVLKP